MTELLRREDVTAAIDNLGGRAEGVLRFRGWQAAVEAERWDRAFSRVRGLVDLFAPSASPAIWRRLLLTGLAAGAHANPRGELGRFTRTAARRADRIVMDDLSHVFEICRRNEHHALAEEVGAALVDVRPDAPAGWFARADAAERRGSKRGWRPRREWANDFRAALERSDNLGADWRVQIGLRYVVASLRTGATHGQIRGALKSIPLTDLTAKQTSWLAFGLAHSTHWLDLIKACDLIDGQLETLTRSGQPVGGTLVDAAEKIFFRLDPTPHHAVVERLEELLKHRILPPTRVESWRRALDTRLALSQSISTPLLEAGDLSGSAAVLAAAHAGVVPVGDDLVSHVARCIDSPTVDRLDELRRDLVRFPDEAWRPVAVLWPELLVEQDEELRDAIDRLGRAWCEHAVEPSYGWWQLAAAFLNVGAIAASKSAAWRGIEKDPQDDVRDDVRDFVLGKLLTRIIRDASLEETERWLAACDEIAQKTRS